MILKNKIGSGSCGTVYLLNDEFVVKIPISYVQSDATEHNVILIVSVSI